MTCKIGFAGTDGRTLLSAVVTSTAKSQAGNDDFHGFVIRGMPAMPEFAKIMKWPISFISTESTSVTSYAQSISTAFQAGFLDYVIPMPEDLFYQGLVDEVAKMGFGDRIAGFSKTGAFIEGDKIACKRLCLDFNVPVADDCREVDARDYSEVLSVVLNMIDNYGGAVIKYPYSAGGKGSRIVLDAWQIKDVYDGIISDYGDKYKKIFGKAQMWPLLIESRMAGVEISFTVFVDKNGNFQILPTAMDYPERFAGPASKDNPITGGMGSISPHPMDTQELISIAGHQIIEPFIEVLKVKQILRPCVLYPGCIVSLDTKMRPKRIRMCEMNIRPGEPEFQPVVRRLRNLGPLVKAMFDGNLNEVLPEVRDDQVSISIPLVTGPGGPDGQKGYPWSCTKNEPVVIDFAYCKKKGIQLVPSGMSYDEEEAVFKSDGTRIVYLNLNGLVKKGEKMVDVAKRLREKLLSAFDSGKIRVVPRENQNGNRLDLRRDIGNHYQIADITFPLKSENLDIVVKLKSAIGKKVVITYSADSAEKHTAKGILTDFDENQYEAEIDYKLMIGTQLIENLTVLP